MHTTDCKKYKQKRYFLVLFFLLGMSSVAQQNKDFKAITIAFYNVENLFSLNNDPSTVYHDRTLRAEPFYTPEIYNQKLKNLSKVIAEIGTDYTGSLPTIVGLCEVENRGVIEDLINQDKLKVGDYDIIHKDSPDRRGIDVALIYRKNIFKPIHTLYYELVLFNISDPLQRVYTRDQLVVTGLLDGEEVHILVNHWPSRSGGEARSRPNRIKAAQLNKKIIDSLFVINPYAKIITMGDLNDDPTSESVKKYLKTKSKKNQVKIKQLYNPMEELFKKGNGTLAWRDSWNLFDQIIISTEWLNKEQNAYRFYKAGIFNPGYLYNPRGRYKGYPYRAYTDGGFSGGYSDHFPVYLILIKEKIDKE